MVLSVDDAGKMVAHPDLNRGPADYEAPLANLSKEQRLELMSALLV